jgi:hypothetical protein
VAVCPVQLSLCPSGVAVVAVGVGGAVVVVRSDVHGGVFFVGFHLQPLLDGLDQPDLSRAWQSGKREKGKKKRKKTEKKEDRNRENREKRKQKQRKQKQRKKTEKQINRRKESETTP